MEEGRWCRGYGGGGGGCGDRELDLGSLGSEPAREICARTEGGGQGGGGINLRKFC